MSEIILGASIMLVGVVFGFLMGAVLGVAVGNKEEA